jgi:hypothetical protein
MITIFEEKINNKTKEIKGGYHEQETEDTPCFPQGAELCNLVSTK